MKKVSMIDVFKNPRFRGKHIVLVGGKIFTAKTGEGASEILKKARKNIPMKLLKLRIFPKRNP